MKNISTLISTEKLHNRVNELGQEITKAYVGKSPLFVCVLKGSFMFMADLIRYVDLPLTVDFLGTSSYGEGTRSSGVVEITKDLAEPIQDRDVIIVEDIVDTGLTVNYLINMLRGRNPASIKLCALLHKPARTKIPVPIDFLGFTIEDKFVIGYGLDHAQKYRNLDYIGVVG